MMNTSEQLELRSLADWLPRGEAWACEAAELLRRAADQIDQLRAEIDRLRPLAAIGAQIEAHTIGKVGHVVLPDGTMWWKPVDRFVAHLLAAGAVSDFSNVKQRAMDAFQRHLDELNARRDAGPTP